MGSFLDNLSFGYNSDLISSGMVALPPFVYI